MRKVKPLTAKEFDRRFDSGEDMGDYFEIDKFHQRIFLEIPIKVFNQVKKEAKRKKVDTQDLLESWITKKVNSLKRS